VFSCITRRPSPTVFCWRRNDHLARIEEQKEAKIKVKWVHRKTIVFAAKLTFTATWISTLLLIICSIHAVFPLGSYIWVPVNCSQNESPIPGLQVTVDSLMPGFAFSQTYTTNATGMAGPFGSGLISGNYSVIYSWGGVTYNKTVTINTSQQYWTFQQYVPNPTITKQFLYNVNAKTPIAGLEVNLYEKVNGVTTWVSEETSNSTGYVTWTVDVGPVYFFNFTWEGKAGSDYVGSFNASCISWSKVDYLQPISGEDK
jgi:hypothetical protein